MIGVGLLVMLGFVPLLILYLAEREQKKQLQLPRFSDYINKCSYLLVIFGCLIIFLTVSWFVAKEVGLIPASPG